MPKKASELNLNLEDVLDDETGLTLAELKKRMKESTTNFNKGQEKLKELEKTLREREAALQQAIANLQQWEAWYRGQQQSQASLPSSNPPDDWRTDPLYQPVVKELDQLRQLLTLMLNAQAQFLQDYNARWATAYGWANQLEVERMKARYPDFNEEEIRKIAQKYQIPTWEGAYQVWKAEQMPTLLEQKEKEAREKALQEAQAKFKTLPTEMGSGPPGPAVPEAPKSYDEAWKGLVGELQSLGLS